LLRTNGDPERRVFDPTTRLLHWLTAGLMLLVFILAFSIDHAKSNTSFMDVLQLHRSFGITVWAVTVVRLAWRQFARFPNWPADMPRPMRLAAQGSEYMLYAFYWRNRSWGFCRPTPPAIGWTCSSSTSSHP
jgi:cytochrome b561